MGRRFDLRPANLTTALSAGKVALVTGGATGIGLGICEQIGRHGGSVAILARRENVIKEAVDKLTAMGIKAFGVAGDVRNYEKCVEGVEAIVRHYGRLDILVNNAAGNFMAAAEDLTPNGFATVRLVPDKRTGCARPPCSSMQLRLALRRLPQYCNRARLPVAHECR